MTHQFGTDIGTKNHVEHPAGQGAFLHRPHDGQRRLLCGCHMPGMSLNHHRATGRQRRGGIAAGGREGQRKVAGAEYRNRAKRHLVLAQIRSR